MTSLFSKYDSVYCPDCHGIVLVERGSKSCVKGHQLPKPARDWDTQEKRSDVRERQAKEVSEQWVERPCPPPETPKCARRWMQRPACLVTIGVG